MTKIRILPFGTSRFLTYKNNYYKAVARGDEKAADKWKERYCALMEKKPHKAV